MSAIHDLKVEPHQVSNVNAEQMRAVLRSCGACSEARNWTKDKDARTAWGTCFDIEWLIWALYSIDRIGVPTDQTTKVIHAYEDRASRFYERWHSYVQPIHWSHGFFARLNEEQSKHLARLQTRSYQFHELHRAQYIAALKSLIEWV